jgi:hypothetical protein
MRFLFLMYAKTSERKVLDTKCPPFFSKTLFLILYFVMRNQLKIYAQDVSGNAAVVRLFYAEG